MSPMRIQPIIFSMSRMMNIWKPIVISSGISLKPFTLSSFSQLYRPQNATQNIPLPFQDPFHEPKIPFIYELLL